jgi:hypothetical protein
MSIDGSGPPRSLAARRSAATNRNSASIRLKVAHARERRSACGWRHFTPVPANPSPRGAVHDRVAPNQRWFRRLVRYPIGIEPVPRLVPVVSLMPPRCPPVRHRQPANTAREAA